MRFYESSLSFNDDLLSATIETPRTFHSGSDEVFDVSVGDATSTIRLNLQAGMVVLRENISIP